jgi:hypothetical protein
MNDDKGSGSGADDESLSLRDVYNRSSSSPTPVGRRIHRRSACLPRIGVESEPFLLARGLSPDSCCVTSQRLGTEKRRRARGGRCCRRGCLADPHAATPLPPIRHSSNE